MCRAVCVCSHVYILNRSLYLLSLDWAHYCWENTNKNTQNNTCLCVRACFSFLSVLSSTLPGESHVWLPSEPSRQVQELNGDQLFAWCCSSSSVANWKSDLTPCLEPICSRQIYRTAVSDPLRTAAWSHLHFLAWFAWARAKGTRRVREGRLKSTVWNYQRQRTKCSEFRYVA